VERRIGLRICQPDATLKKNLADEIFRNLLIPARAGARSVPSVQHLHGEAVALSDPSDQDGVRPPPVSHLMARWVGRVGVACGSMTKAKYFKLSQ